MSIKAVLPERQGNIPNMVLHCALGFWGHELLRVWCYERNACIYLHRNKKKKKKKVEEEIIKNCAAITNDNSVSTVYKHSPTHLPSFIAEGQMLVVAWESEANWTRFLKSIWYAADSERAVRLKKLHFIDNRAPSRILTSWNPLSELRPSVSSRHRAHWSRDTQKHPCRRSWPHSESPGDKFHVLRGQAEAKRNGHTMERIYSFRWRYVEI